MNKESIHQQFERFMRDEMDDIERERYIKSDRYKKIIKTFEFILKEKKKN
tara:strand:+ start:74 stop:223 length:150 start_codon:yes stop_codon:yes gene_type:complete